MQETAAPSTLADAPCDAETLARRKRRAAGLVTAICAAGILAVATFMEPSPTGLGTHSDSFGLPACGWIVMFNTPCPTCGMTTAFAHAANGNLPAAIYTQPLGGVLAIATAITLIVGVYVAVTGSRVASELKRLWGRKTAWLLGAMLLLSWVFKIITYKEWL